MSIKVQSQTQILMPRPASSPPPRTSSIFTSAEAPRDAVDIKPLARAEAKRPAIASGRPEPGPYPTAKWTVLNYSAADNNLYAYIYDDVASMEKFGSTGSVQLVTQLDHQGGEAYRFRIEQDQAGTSHSDKVVDSPVLERLGPVNMSDPKTLSDFISWGMKNFPAERFMLVIADHGKGWEGLVQDETHQGWMSVPQLKEALVQAEMETGRKLNVIGFDACQMASVEVASQLKDHAQYMVASQAPEGREGWPYQHILSQGPLSDLQRAHLFKSDVESRTAVELVVNGAAEHSAILPTMSALDLSQVGALEAGIQELSQAMIKTGIGGADLREVRHQTQAFSFVYDLGDFLDNLAQLPQDRRSKELTQAVEKCRDLLEKVVIAEHHSPEFPRASGLTIELKRKGPDYLALDFAQKTGWGEAISKFSQA